MKIILENDSIKATIDSLGAELIHLTLKDTDYDYMWKGDPAYWGGRSPVLFPIIGSLNEGNILIEGKTYTMGNHGFARKSNFACIGQEAHTATFRLTESEATLAQYPYKFHLDLTYTLIGTAISIQYRVTNKDQASMPFQIGTHPAFNCPMGQTDQLTQWYLEFEKKETLSRIGLKDNLIDFENLTLTMDNSRRLDLNPQQFYTGAIVLKSLASNNVELKSDDTKESITVSWNNLPHMGIWQPEDAPFLCIEPWQGHGDPIGFDGEMKDKPEVVNLGAGKTYEAELRIRIA